MGSFDLPLLSLRLFTSRAASATLIGIDGKSFLLTIFSSLYGKGSMCTFLQSYGWTIRLPPLPVKPTVFLRLRDWYDSIASNDDDASVVQVPKIRKLGWHLSFFPGPMGSILSSNYFTSAHWMSTGKDSTSSIITHFPSLTAFVKAPRQWIQISKH